MATVIDRMSEPTADCLAGLVEESERQGLSFVRRLVQEWAGGTNRFDRPGEALFVAIVAGQVVGVCGLNVDPYAARPEIGRLRHLCVLLTYRRIGVGQALVREVVKAARGRFERLRLSTTNPEAARLYERLGFRPHAVEHGTHAMELS
jgi:GNAT superfamily N-acetyltransferase